MWLKAGALLGNPHILKTSVSRRVRNLCNQLIFLLKSLDIPAATAGLCHWFFQWQQWLFLAQAVATPRRRPGFAGSPSLPAAPGEAAFAHGITEHPELQGNHRDHRSSLWPCTGQSQNPTLCLGELSKHSLSSGTVTIPRSSLPEGRTFS